MGKFKDFVRGEITLKVESLEIEKFINIATKNKIRMWNLKRENFTTITFTIFQDDYKYLRKAIRKTKSKSKVLNKSGANFILNAILRRKFFIIGSLVFLMFIFVFSNIIFRIEIIGNKNVDNKSIIQSLEKNGIKHGMFKYGIKLRDVESLVLKDFEQLSVVNIKFIGTKAIINVVERTMPPKMDMIDTPMDIICTKEGVISKILALKGQGIVEIGDYVKKGDVLISGIVRDELGVPLRIDTATGDVYAKTWYEVEDSLEYNYKQEKFTGNEKKRTYFNIYNKDLALKSKIKYKNYDKIKDVKEYKILNFGVPIQKITEVYKEKIITEKKLTEKEALKVLTDKIDLKAKKLIPKDATILDRKFEEEKTSKGLKLKITYIVEESIGEPKEISPISIEEEKDKTDIEEKVQ